MLLATWRTSCSSRHLYSYFLFNSPVRNVIEITMTVLMKRLLIPPQLCFTTIMIHIIIPLDVHVLMLVSLPMYSIEPHTMRMVHCKCTGTRIYTLRMVDSHKSNYLRLQISLT